MPGIDDLVDGLAGGSDIDSLVDGLAGDSPAPEAQMTVGEPEVIKAQPDATGQALGRGLDAPAVSRAKPWYESLLEPNTRGGLLRRADQAAGRGVDAPLTEDSAEEAARLEQQKASALKHLTDMGSASGMTKKVGAQLAGPFMGAGGASIPANMVNAGVQQTLQSAAEDDDRTALENLESGGKAALTSGALMKGGELATRAGKALLHSANKLRPRVFMSPGQISTYEAAHPEPDALAKLGARAREAGLFKGGLGPATARRVESNAEKLLATSGPSMGRFEDDLVKRGIDPAVDVQPIGEDLRQGAEYLQKRATSASPAQAEAFRREAAAVQPMETTRRWLPREMPAEQLPLDLPPGEIGNRSMPVSAPVLPEQMSLPGTESAPRQLGLDFGPAPVAPPPAPAPAQQMSLPLREPEQMSLRLPETSQGSLQFGPGTSVPQNLPPQTELADQTAGALVKMRQGQQPQLANDPAWDAAVAPPAVESLEAQQLLMPGADQMSLPGTSATPRGVTVPTAPAPASATPRQMSLPSQQLEMPGSAPAEGVTQWSPGALEGEQGALNMSRQPERFEDLTRPRTSRPFSEAIADKRQLQNEVKWNKSAMQDSMGGEAARKASWVGHARQIDQALDAAAARGEIAPEALAAYRKDMRDFSTAATVHEPAMRMANRQGEIGLGAADMLAGAAAGDPGMALASRAGRGRGAASGAAIMEGASAASSATGAAMTAAGRTIPAIGQALQNNPPGTPKSDIEREANSDTKAQLKGWWQHLTGR